MLRSLPDPTVGYESGPELFLRVAQWMGIDCDPDSLPAPAVSDLARIIADNQLLSAVVPEEEFDRIARPRLLAIQQGGNGPVRIVLPSGTGRGDTRCAGRARTC